jgi:osmotically-inducible protein OsmY
MYPSNVKRILYFTAIFMVLPWLVFAQADSKKLATRVMNHLQSYYTEIFDITADNNGKVVVKGETNTLYDKLRIFDLISQVPGVKYIENDIEVNAPILPDEVIKDNIIQEMKLVSSILEPDRIKVNVDNGVVFLTGEVSYFREKIMAETVASWQQGVKGIMNDLNVLSAKKAVSDENLTAVISEVLKNSFPLDSKVTFKVDQGAVTLTGPVAGLWDKNQIEKEISKILGVKKVVNNLQVQKEIG